MNAVGILGSYIKKGVHTVSGPFHPFGGAVDIVVVEQQDGSFKSSPWDVRLGKFQGVLKTKEKVVNIVVNGVEASFHMFLDHKGEAYFLREVDDEEKSASSSSSGDETDLKSQQEQNRRRMLGSKSSNCDAVSSVADDGTEKSKVNGKTVKRTGSRRSRILGFVWGRKSMKEDCYKDTTVPRIDSLERAEMAANLLEVKWSTNLSPRKLKKEDTSRVSSTKTSHGKDEKEFKTDDGDSHATSAVDGNMRNNLDHQVGDEEFDSCGEHIANGSQFVLKNLELSVEIAREMSSLDTQDQVLETFIAGAKPSKGVYEMKSEISREIEQIAGSAEDTVNAMGIISNSTGLNSQIPHLNDCDTYYAESFNEECSSNETNIVTQAFSISEDKDISHGVRSLKFCGSSESSIMTMDESSVHTHETSHLANGGSGVVSVHTERLHVTTEVHSEDTVTSAVAEDFEIETEKLDVPKKYPQQINPCNYCVYEGNTMDQEEPLAHTDSHTQLVPTDQIPQLDEEVKSNSTCSTCSSDLQDEKGMDYSLTSKVQCSFNSSGNGVVTKEICSEPSTEIDEEQFLFSDFDVSNTDVIRTLESDSQHCSSRFVNRNYETCFSPDYHIKRGTTSPIIIPQSHPNSSREVDRLVASLPNMQAGIDSPIACEIYHSLSYPVDSNSKSLKWMQCCKDVSSSKSGGNEEAQVSQENSKFEESQVSGELKSVLPNPAVGYPADATFDPGENWKLWPFSFKRSRSRKATHSAGDNYTNLGAEKASDRNIGMDGDAVIFEHKAKKKMVRSISPTSEQLASLNLKEGRNIVTFTFSTAVLGKQQVDARIYLWKWNTRIVISDVDGTITKSDLLGQFMPFVGMDWSQSGVAHLFSAIKENGYQLLFLSARAISQAYHTRQFLFNLKQDGKALPEGPVVISPDGLFPSLYREVIRRAPHEFKIACLERIRELFPPDCNPFYAGFGNRDTDEISYLKVGIPKGKIFIINPKGEVAVNRRVDTKSYTSLRTLVNGMFPPTASFEQEDFNSWNYWKLPPPMTDI